MIPIKQRVHLSSLGSLICSIDYLLARQWNFSHLIPVYLAHPTAWELLSRWVVFGNCKNWRQTIYDGKTSANCCESWSVQGRILPVSTCFVRLVFSPEIATALPCLAPPANQQTIWNLGKKTHWSTISGWFRNDGSLEWLIKDLAPSDIENISLKFAILAILPQILVYGKICISSPLCLGDLLLQSITSAHTNCFGAFLWYVSGIHHFVLFQIMITGNNISLQFYIDSKMLPKSKLPSIIQHRPSPINPKDDGSPMFERHDRY